MSSARPLTFLSGNPKKVMEMGALMAPEFLVTGKALDLPEIQADQVKHVVGDKLARAYEATQAPVMCEDTGVYIEKLNGFPGPLIKWYLQKLGPELIVEQCGGSKAYAETVIGFSDGSLETFTTGQVPGMIATEVLHSETPEQDFGWDPIFIPKVDPENTRSFAQMSMEEKNAISMRAQAARELKKALLASPGWPEPTASSLV